MNNSGEIIQMSVYNFFIDKNEMLFQLILIKKDMYN